MLKKGIGLLMLILCIGLMSACNKPKPAVNQLPQETTLETEPETTQAEETTAPIILELEMTELTLTEIGQRVKIYSGEVPAQEIFWYSADSAVAAVEEGEVIAMGSGVANIYGVYGDQSLLCTVTSTAEYSTDKTPILAAPTYESVDGSFFDDAVFVGDSISVKLSYCSAGELGNAQFLVQTSYGLHNAVNDLMYTSYRGKKYKDVEDAVAATGAKKVFIMLGVNDIGRFGLDENMEKWRILIESIRQACPDVEIYIQSMMPIWSGAQTSKLNNSKVHDYNFALRFFAEQYGCGYIDVFPYMQDHSGGLAAEYCSDKYVHVTEKGVAVWLSVLQAYANYPQEGT